MTRVAFDIVEHIPSGRKVVVSTINRLCSSVFASDSAYAETMVFETDGCGKLTNILDQTESSVDSLVGHNKMVEKYSKGYPVDEDVDD